MRINLRRICETKPLPTRNLSLLHLEVHHHHHHHNREKPRRLLVLVLPHPPPQLHLPYPPRLSAHSPKFVFDPKTFKRMGIAVIVSFVWNPSSSARRTLLPASPRAPISFIPPVSTTGSATTAERVRPVGTNSPNRTAVQRTNTPVGSGCGTGKCA